MDALIANARFHFHKQLFETNTLTLTSAGVASNADTSSRGSKAIARRIVDILVEEQHHAVATVDKISGQTLGKQWSSFGKLSLNCKICVLEDGQFFSSETITS